MSAQPNKIPEQTPERKPRTRKVLTPGQPDLAVAPRSLSDIDSEFRGAPDKFTAVPYEFIADRFRLSSGATFYALTDYVAHISGRRRKPGEALSFEAEISITEAAMICRVNERSIDRELLYLIERQMAIVSRLAGRKAVVRLMVRPEQVGEVNFPGWANIPQSYEEWAAEKKQHIDQRADESAAEDENPATGTVRVKKTRVKPGHASEPQAIDAHVKTLTVKCPKDSPLDIQLSGKVVSGELVLSIAGVEQESASKSRSKRDAKPAESVRSEVSSRHTRLENMQKPGAIPANGGTGERAEELAKIWDPILWEKLGKTLSGDSRALVAACKAIGNTPIQVVEEAAKERATRRISRTSDIPSICQEIRINWEKSKDLPARKSLPTRAEIDAMIDEERRVLAEKNRALKGGRK